MIAGKVMMEMSFTCNSKVKALKRMATVREEKIEKPCIELLALEVSRDFQ